MPRVLCALGLFLAYLAVHVLPCAGAEAPPSLAMAGISSGPSTVDAHQMVPPIGTPGCAPLGDGEGHHEECLALPPKSEGGTPLTALLAMLPFLSPRVTAPSVRCPGSRRCRRRPRPVPHELCVLRR